jgi:hypothetical protein
MCHCCRYNKHRLFAATSAYAQAYPTKPIKFVVPFGAGTATDSVGRILAQAMGDALGQTITIENKAGANVFQVLKLLKMLRVTRTPSWLPPAPLKLRM